jgi:hypothetical protein
MAVFLNKNDSVIYDFSSTAYFYYDRPVSDLPVLPSREVRVLDLAKI